MSDKSYLEQRVHSRVSVKVPVQYRLIDSPDELEKVKGNTALAVDLSLEGVYLKTSKPVKVGDIFRLDISVPNPYRQLFAYAEVVWVKNGGWMAKNGAGLRLLLMAVEDRDFLKTYLEKAGSK